MLRVDLENPVSVRGGGNDRKIACETLADGDQPPEETDLPDVPPDFPPESFWLSKDAEFDWFDRNAVLERKESTKGNSNSTNLNPNLHPNSNLNSSSRRFSKSSKSRASIIGLPNTQKINHVDTNRRNCKPANIRMFPKRSGSVGKTNGSVAEPSSPKVSCMGRVRSKRGRRRSSETTTATAKKADKAKTGGGHRRSGFFGGFTSIFRSGHRKIPAVEREEQPVDSPPRSSVRMKMREISVSVETVAEPPGLGGMVRFSSGRKSDSWSADNGGPTGRS